MILFYMFKNIDRISGHAYCRNFISAQTFSLTFICNSTKVDYVVNIGYFQFGSNDYKVFSIFCLGREAR